MIASKAAVPNGLMNAIRRSTRVLRRSPDAPGRDRLRGSAGPAGTASCRGRARSRRSRSATSRPVVGPGAVAEDVAGAMIRSSKPGAPADDRQVVGVNGRMPAHARAKRAAREFRQRRGHPLADERDAGEVRLPVEARGSPWRSPSRYEPSAVWQADSRRARPSRSSRSVANVSVRNDGSSWKIAYCLTAAGPYRRTSRRGGIGSVWTIWRRIGRIGRSSPSWAAKRRAPGTGRQHDRARREIGPSRSGRA